MAIIKPEEVQVFWHMYGGLVWSGSLPYSESHFHEVVEVTDHEAKRAILKEKFNMECVEDIIDKLHENNS